ncbi:MAG TPA: AbrB/MazE/SpoVT family DNA-binding domain-containing protein [Coriobacteriia bacterium]
MPTAKVTSKGQVTIPVEIRRALGVEAGDMLVFEAKAEYVAVKRQETAHEYFSRLREKYPSGPARYDSDDEAIAAYFSDMTEEEVRGGETLYVCRFTRESIDAAVGSDDEGR